MAQFNQYPAPQLPLTGNEQLMLAQQQGSQVVTVTATLAQFVAAMIGVLPLSGGQLTGLLGFTINDTLVGAGTDQATATPLTSQLCVIKSAPTGTGFVLPDASVIGVSFPWIMVKNQDPTNYASIYPPVGGQINSLGDNAYAEIAPNSSIILAPGTTPLQWWV
jgi:hypothetical protein